MLYAATRLSSFVSRDPRNRNAWGGWQSGAALVDTVPPRSLSAHSPIRLPMINKTVGIIHRNEPLPTELPRHETQTPRPAVIGDRRRGYRHLPPLHDQPGDFGR